MGKGEQWDYLFLGNSSDHMNLIVELSDLTRLFYDRHRNRVGQRGLFRVSDC